MSEHSKTKKPAKSWRFFAIFALSLIGGYLVGKWVALSTDATFLEVDGAISISAIAALTIAAVYFIMGAFVLAAVTAPRLTAPLVTGMGAEDLREQKRLLQLQGACVITFGIALAALALAGPVQVMGNDAAAAIFIAAVLVGGALYWLSMRELDELTRAATMEAAEIGYGLAMLIIVGWAGFAHLDMIDGPAFLDLLSVFWATAIIASVIASYRRGLLQDK